MRDPCIKAVQGAIGRSITQAESRGIESKITDAMRRLARDDPQRWQSLGADQRLREAAQFAAKELVQEATLKKVRIAQTILAHDRIENYTSSQVKSGFDKNRLASLDRVLSGKNDGKNNISSVESQTHGTTADSLAKLIDAWQAIHPKFLGLFRNKAAEDSFYLALHGETKVDKSLIAAAQKWKETTEALRQRFNAAGGQMGKLEDWGAPHSWSQELWNKAGRDQIVADLMSRVDRSKYVHDDGRLYSDDDMKKFLSSAYDSVTTNGANKDIRTDIPGGSIKANRHVAERQIHFKDAQSALEMFHAYSRRNLFQVLTDHVRAMSRDIALAETFGPNSDLVFKHFLETFTKEAQVADREHLGKYDSQAHDTLNLYNYLAGNDRPPANQKVANVMSDIRQWFSAVMLGSAPITALADEGTLHLTAHVNNLPQLKVFANELRALNPLNRSEKALAMRAGLMIETMIDQGNRFAAENAGPRLSARVSGALMRASGLIKLDEMRRRSISTALLDQIGDLTRRVDSLDKLSADDNKMLKQSGITEQDWQVLRLAQPEKWRGNDTVLTPESIYRVSDADIKAALPDVNPSIAKQKAASSLLGFVHEQQNLVVPVPGARQRSLISHGAPAGTARGEIMRAISLFRSFPFSYFEKHFSEAINRYDTMTGKVGWIAAIVASQTILGAVAMEVNDMLTGRNPRALFGGNHLLRNWLSAALKGGALGVYGDFLFSDPSTGGQGLAANVVGPMGAFADDTDRLTRGNLLKLLRGEKTEAGSEAIKFARRYIVPGSNLWYTKAVTDNLIFNELQEYFSPGYLARAQARSRSTYGTSYWWRPGAPVSQAQAPDLGTLVKEK